MPVACTIDSTSLFQSPTINSTSKSQSTLESDSVIVQRLKYGGSSCFGTSSSHPINENSFITCYQKPLAFPVGSGTFADPYLASSTLNPDNAWSRVYGQTGSELVMFGYTIIHGYSAM